MTPANYALHQARAKQLRLVDPQAEEGAEAGRVGFALTVFGQKSNQAKLIRLEL